MKVRIKVFRLEPIQERICHLKNFNLTFYLRNQHSCWILHWITFAINSEWDWVLLNRVRFATSHRTIWTTHHVLQKSLKCEKKCKTDMLLKKYNKRLVVSLSCIKSFPILQIKKTCSNHCLLQVGY